MCVMERCAEDLAAAELAASVAGFALDVPAETILTQKRGTAEAAYARHLAMYLCHTVFELSLTRVGAAFGRDRSTVAHACHLFEDRREEPQVDLWLGAIEAMLQATPNPSLLRSRGR